MMSAEPTDTSDRQTYTLKRVNGLRFGETRDVVLRHWWCAYGCGWRMVKRKRRLQQQCGTDGRASAGRQSDRTVRPAED